jgi:glycosyltransferase involved in cell wall biosynthesis
MGIDLQPYLETDTSRDFSSVTVIGRLSPDRNVELVLKALASIPDLPWSCTIVGSEERRSYSSKSGYVEHLKAIATSTGIANRVVFTGPLYEQDLRRAYTRTGIFVSSSRYENFGQAILEAAASGCALVTTPTGVALDLVQEGVTGFLFEPDAPESLARHLRWLLEHPVEQATMGLNARALAGREYGWDLIVKRYTDLYEDVIDQARWSRKVRFAGSPSVRTGIQP